MADTGVDKKRRRFLIGATSAVGAVGVGAIAIPFIGSLTPSARALAAGAPVEVDISKLELGAMMSIEWQGKVVFVVNRTPEMLSKLPSIVPQLKDPTSLVSDQPEYVDKETRSRNDEVLVMLGKCTHLGCAPKFRPEVAPADLGADWQGGFYCPCHGSRFDLAGRVFKGAPAGTNMEIPPYYFISDSLILIGENGVAA
jgi:ubiquinol-cytochrome c reductase iron-sulfur subunit